MIINNKVSSEILEERITKKYRYVTELVEYSEKRFFIDFPGGHICTVYETEEDARKDIPHMAILFHHDPKTATISEEMNIAHKFLHHRYKLKSGT